MERSSWILLLSLPLLIVGMYLVRRGAQRQGIGMFGAVCPRCAGPLPEIRKATSFREAWFGGWTCANCGCKVDKYGKKRNW
jgi:hypothetical protein